MKYFKFLILFLIVSINTNAAQKICLPESEMDKSLALTDGAGDVYCHDKPQEQCICKPKGFGWHELKKVGPSGNRVLVFDGIKKAAEMSKRASENAARIQKDKNRSDAKKRIQALDCSAQAVEFRDYCLALQ